MPTTLIIRTAGTNCDQEMIRGFQLAGSDTRVVHLDSLIADPAPIESCDLIGFPGGFSYGDDIASGRVFAVKVRERLYPALREAAGRGVPMLGVCNGFQVMAQAGLLPDPLTGGKPTIALTGNIGGRFIDDWARVEVDAESPCVWTRGLDLGLNGEERAHALRLPLASGEGRFVAANEALLARLESNHQVPLRYVDNLNGSQGAVAGVCDPTGRVFGLMPHPDRYLEWVHHPYWTRLPASVRTGDTPGLRLFRNAVESVVMAGA
ncbi:MAG: phosphoribosylformylglycinamidine synthase subunit PurQ [Phycisphaeraceae bacterium]|nr:phosphoribosylformylglycinamidine synthase subunit PurQ [Phycisphaeraceae bacterium]MCB9847461.1 phosphoribosylformylglycinamidine synthase subunit PurQ [Phycisphaeraceae bacterium]